MPYRVISDVKQKPDRAGLIRTWLIEGPRGAVIAVWLYDNGRLRAVNEKGKAPPGSQRAAALDLAEMQLYYETPGAGRIYNDAGLGPGAYERARAIRGT